MVIQNLQKNIENAKKLVSTLIKNIAAREIAPAPTALKYAIITDRKVIPEKVKKDLDIIIGKYVR